MGFHGYVGRILKLLDQVIKSLHEFIQRGYAA